MSVGRAGIEIEVVADLDRRLDRSGRSSTPLGDAAGRRASDHRAEPAGFFVLRTPLLPFDELLGLGEGLAAPGAPNDSSALEEALASDQDRVRRLLRRALDRPDVREAIFVASPDLHAAMLTWEDEPDGARGPGVELALLRYLARMAGRATPFGLFAGCSVGMVGATSRLALASRPRYRRSSRLTGEYVSALAEAVAGEPQVRRNTLHRPNQSLYRGGGSLRWVQVQGNGEGRAHRLVATPETAELDAVLSAAHGGALPAQLAAALAGTGSPLAEAEARVEVLIDTHLLMPDLGPTVSGPPALDTLLQDLAAVPELADTRARLSDAGVALVQLDAAGLGNSPDHYLAVERLLAPLPSPLPLSRLVQVDMVKPAEATLAPAVLGEIRRGAEILQSMASWLPGRSMARFRQSFTERYATRQVPLLEALDPELGIGFPPARHTSPLLAGLSFPAEPSTPSTPSGPSPREQVLLPRLVEAAVGGDTVLELSGAELDAIADDQQRPLEAFAVVAAVAAASPERIDRGDFRVLIRAVSSPSGAILLARFTHADPVLLDHVRRLIEQEEALDPDAVFAEVAHLPEGKSRNVVLRPVLRRHEIVYLGRSGVPAADQILPQDLMVSVVDDRVLLWSRRLGRRVVPRVTNAHAFTASSHPLYRFLGLLECDRTGMPWWDWSGLPQLAFLPRLTHGRVVLCPARWRLDTADLNALRGASPARRVGLLRSWREERRLPRFVVITDGDAALPVDLDNPLFIEVLVHLVSGKTSAVVEEMFPSPDELCVTGPEGRFVHEVVVPFVRPAVAIPKGSSRTPPVAPTNPESARQRFPPGSEWLYVELFCGPSTCDQVLVELVAPFARWAKRSGACKNWFFLRYFTPAHHLRLRFNGDPSRLSGEVEPALLQAAASLEAKSLLWRIQMGTYEREVERYGGPAGVALAERAFHADSEAVVALLCSLGGTAPTWSRRPGRAEASTVAADRSAVAVVGIDRLLEDFGLEPAERLQVVSRLRSFFASQQRLDAQLEKGLSERFRRERRHLEGLLSGGAGPPATEALDQRSKALSPIVDDLRHLDERGDLSVPLGDIVASLVHLYVNRLMRSDHAAHELVLYDSLQRLYRSRVARSRA